jgi:carbonic anhydrase
VTAFPQLLIEGYGAFRAGRLAQERERYAALAAAGQAPEIMVIGCCDSRVSPEVIFDCGPGEIFVVRNVANLVPPYAPDGHHHGTSAAIEFAVVGLQVSHVVVMGHARCGGIKALSDGAGGGSDDVFIGRWMSIMQPLLTSLGEEAGQDPTVRLKALELAAIGQSLENLESFPFVREKVARGALDLHGAYFDVATGELKVLEPTTGCFVTPPSA